MAFADMVSRDDLHTPDVELKATQHAVWSGMYLIVASITTLSPWVPVGRADGCWRSFARLPLLPLAQLIRTPRCPYLRS